MPVVVLLLQYLGVLQFLEVLLLLEPLQFLEGSSVSSPRIAISCSSFSLFNMSPSSLCVLYSPKRLRHPLVFPPARAGSCPCSA